MPELPSNGWTEKYLAVCPHSAMALLSDKEGGTSQLLIHETAWPDLRVTVLKYTRL